MFKSYYSNLKYLVLLVLSIYMYVIIIQQREPWKQHICNGWHQPHVFVFLLDSQNCFLLNNALFHPCLGIIHQRSNLPCQGNVKRVWNWKYVYYKISHSCVKNNTCKIFKFKVIIFSSINKLCQKWYRYELLLELYKLAFTPHLYF